MCPILVLKIASISSTLASWAQFNRKIKSFIYSEEQPLLLSNIFDIPFQNSFDEIKLFLVVPCSCSSSYSENSSHHHHLHVGCLVMFWTMLT